MKEQIIIAGFGGQGVMSMGQMLAYAGMVEGKKVSWLPSYGPEMRGGTANCQVIISDDEIAAPIISRADTVIAMNLPSLLKFESKVVAGGHLFINSSLIEQKASRDDIHVHYVNANEIANALGNSRVAGMVIMGNYLEKKRTVQTSTVEDSLIQVLGERKAGLIPVNKEALESGAQIQ